MDPSTEFGNMMQTAMKMKSAQMDQDRRRFETWPQFLQNSMWERNEKTLALRELPPASRLDGAAALKEEGNEFFRNKKYTSAVEAYEAAVGSFVYAKQLDPDWKKKGIKDETIDLIDERGTGEDKERVDAFLVSCYSNLAASYLARATANRPPPGGTVDGEFKLCVQASTAGIEITPTSKALYRRARARSEPFTATDDDVDEAIRDLVAASSLEPEDKAVRALLARLRKEKKEKKEKEKTGMAGMFAKGELYDKSTLDAMAKRDESQRKIAEKTADRPRTVEDVEREQKDAARAVEHLRSQGRHAEADSLEEKLRGHQAELAKFKKQMAEEEERAKRHDPMNIDFLNPTPEQVEDAKKHGIDLFDPLVRKELQRLQEERAFEGEGEDDEEDDDGDTTGGGVSKGQRDGRVTSGAGSTGDVAQQGGMSPRTRMMIMAIAFAFGLYRIWQVLGPAILGSARAAAGGRRGMGLGGGFDITGGGPTEHDFTDLQHDEM